MKFKQTRMISKVPAQDVQREAEPANNGAVVAGVNVFPYLGSWVVHPPGRLGTAEEDYRYRW